MSHGHPPHKHRPLGTCIECVAEKAERELAEANRFLEDLNDHIRKCHGPI